MITPFEVENMIVPASNWSSRWIGIYLVPGPLTAPDSPLVVGRDEWHETTRAHMMLTLHNQLHPSRSISKG